MARNGESLSKRNVLSVLRRVGHSEEEITALDKVLPDQFELRRYQDLLAGYGVDCERLIDEMGGSP